MCYGCIREYVEEYGEPLKTDAALSVVPLIERLYEAHPAGGAAHIVTDDWNIEDEHIEWCIANSDHGDVVALAVLNEMRRLSIRERMFALAIHDGLI